MKTYLFSFIVTAVLAALMTPVVRRLAVRVGAVSSPGGRNVNARSVPRLGGIAIALSSACTLLMLLRVETNVGMVVQAEPLRVVGLLGGAFIVFVVGVLDDTRRVRALYKLYAQVAAAVLAYACGFRIDAISIGFNSSLSMGVFGLPITVIWIVGVVNAINLIDGLDGLAGGIVFFAGLTNFVVAYVGDNVLLAAVMAVMLGAVVGFLFFNFNPARIFMGDSGSYFLGFLMGTSSIGGYKASTAVGLLVPMIALGVPIFDTLFTVVRRFLERRPLFSPDRGHIHHRLLDMGLTHRRAVLTLYGVSIVFTVAAIAISLGRSWEVGVATFVAGIVAIGLFRSVGYFDYLVRLNRQKERVRWADTEALRRTVPDVLASFGAAGSEDEVWAVFERMLTGCGLANAELRAGDGGALRTWTANANVEREDLVSARFPIGSDARARAAVVFRWEAVEHAVHPQTEILLQLAVDALAQALERAQSDIGPTTLGAQSAQSSSPDPTEAAHEEPAVSTGEARVSA
ncbi:MAG TPA: MraY family glycosyltransferase [Polyangiaceae bacterium]|jgi:UDP-GlcNAc:undecaprenyl-phosphate GlcNAc-1-phosphate transferase